MLLFLNLCLASYHFGKWTPLRWPQILYIGYKFMFKLLIFSQVVICYISFLWLQ